MCRILGTYVLANSDTSSLINFLVSDVGSAGWMTNIEQLTRSHLDSLPKACHGLVRGHRFYLSGMKVNKGTFVRGNGVLDNLERRVDKRKGQFMTRFGGK